MKPAHFWLASLPLLGACAGTSRIEAMHDPLYRAEVPDNVLVAREGGGLAG